MTRDLKLVLVALLAATGLSIAASEGRPRRSAALRRSASTDARTPAGGAGAPPDGRSGAAHGRHADTPSQIPARGWWDIAKRVVQHFSDHRIMTEAAGIAFYVLLSLFPALAALVSLYGLFADPNTISGQLNALSGLIPGGGMQIISDQVHSLAAHGSALGFALLFGLATSLWTANQGVKSLFDALNIVYDEREKRGYVLRTALALVFTAGSLIFLLIAMAAVVALPVALGLVGLGSTADLLLRLLRWPVLLVVVAVFLALIYRFGPSREKARWRWVTWGGVFAAVMWVIASAAFSWYVSSFGN